MAADPDNDRPGFPPPRIDHEDVAEGYGCMLILLGTLVIGVGLAIWGLWY